MLLVLNLVLDLQAEVVSLGDHWSAETKGWALKKIDVDSVHISTGFSLDETVDDLPSHDGENPFTGVEMLASAGRSKS